jgi:hypothetical protein
VQANQAVRSKGCKADTFDYWRVRVSRRLLPPLLLLLPWALVLISVGEWI